MAPVRERGYLKFDEFLRLAKLKSSQGMHHVALNESHIVEAVTRIAFSSQLEDERVRIGLLTSLRGVDIPRASALLCWTHPGPCDMEYDKRLHAAGLKANEVSVHGPEDQDFKGYGCAYRITPAPTHLVLPGSTVTYRSAWEGG